MNSKISGQLRRGRLSCSLPSFLLNEIRYECNTLAQLLQLLPLVSPSGNVTEMTRMWPNQSQQEVNG